MPTCDVLCHERSFFYFSYTQAPVHESHSHTPLSRATGRCHAKSGRMGGVRHNSCYDSKIGDIVYRP